MPEVRILLLGPPEVHLDDAPIHIQRRTVRAFLFYLASRGGTIGRQTLLELFWENQPDKLARRRLQETLNQLRRALPLKELLLTTRDMVGLKFERIYVDQLEFQDLVDRTGRIPWNIPASEPLPEHIVERLLHAVGLWRSPKYLDGIGLPSTRGLNDWRIRTTRQMEHLRAHILERLSDHAYATGDLEASLQFARQALDNDELNEDLHYRVMRSMIQMGQTAEAQDYFMGLQDRLRSALDTNPGPQLVNLYRSIREERQRLLPPAPKPAWHIQPSMQSPFVGRKKALAQLHQALQKGGGVFILGESGQGKTRLMQEFASQTVDQARLLYANCRPAENNLPFQPVLDVLRYQIQPDEWLSLPGTWASQLTLLMPELSKMRPELERPLVEFSTDSEPGQAMALLLEASRQVFSLIAQKERLLFFLDDAQWADEATLQLVAFLLERYPFNRHSLLIVCIRSEEIGDSLQAVLSSLQQSSQFKLLSLENLTQEETASLINLALGFHPSLEFNERLLKETGGNPLFILETLRSLQELDAQNGESRLVDSQVELPLPESIQTLIQDRLEELSPPARQTLEIAAVIGPEFDPEIVGIVGNLESHALVDILEELQKHLLIEPIGHSPQDVRHHFRHIKFREVLLQNINPMRARLLNRQVVRVLEERLGDRASDQASVLAQHYEDAGEYRRAFDNWLQAARRSRQLFSVADATQAFRRAGRLIDVSFDITDQQIHDLYVEWTETAYEIDDAAAIQTLNDRLRQLAEERNSPLLTGTALNGLCQASMAKNEYEQGLAYADQAIQNLEETENLYQQMEGYNNRGVFLYMLGRFEEAEEAFQDALAIGVSSNDRQVMRARANAHYQISIVNTLAGWPSKAYNHARLSLKDFTTLNRAHGQVAAYSALAFSRYLGGSLEQARRDSQTGIELAERIHSWRLLGYLCIYRAMIELDSGNIETAFQYAQRGIEIGGRFGHTEIIGECRRVLGDLYYWLQDYQHAVEYYQRALESGGQFMAFDALFRLGLARCLNGDRKEGQRELDQAQSGAHSAGMGAIAILAQLSQALVFQAHEQWEQVEKIASQVHEEAKKRGIPSVQWRAANLLGDVAASQGNLQEAISHYETVARETAQAGFLWIELTAQENLGKALKDPKPRQRIETLLEQLEQSVQREEILPAFQAFRTKVLSGLE